MHGLDQMCQNSWKFQTMNPMGYRPPTTDRYIQSPDVTFRSGSDLNISMHQRHLTPPKKPTKANPVTIYKVDAVGSGLQQTWWGCSVLC